MTLRSILYVLPLTFVATVASAEEAVKCPDIISDHMPELQKSKEFKTDDGKVIWSFQKKGGNDLNIAQTIEKSSPTAQDGVCTYKAIFNPEDFEVGDDGYNDVGTTEREWFEDFTLTLKPATSSAKK